MCGKNGTCFCGANEGKIIMRKNELRPQSWFQYIILANFGGAVQERSFFYAAVKRQSWAIWPCRRSKLQTLSLRSTLLGS